MSTYSKQNDFSIKDLHNIIKSIKRLSLLFTSQNYMFEYIVTKFGLILTIQFFYKLF